MDENIINLNTLDKLKALGFCGHDRCLSVSLDSGLIWRQEGEKILFIYNIRHNCDSNWFDRRSFSTTTNVKDEWNWVFDSFNRRSDIADWMAGMEKTYDDFFDMPFAEQVAALFDLYGYEQVFGSSYWEGFEIGDYSRED